MIMQYLLLMLAVAYAKVISVQDETIQVYDTEGSYSGSIPASIGISNTDIEQCRTENITQNSTKVYAKLLKFDGKPKTSVLHCSLRVEGSTFYCGNDGAYTYIYPGKPIKPQWMLISRDECQRLVLGEKIRVRYEYGSLKGHLNITTRRRGINTIAETVLGKRFNNGACIGGALVDDDAKLHSNMIYDIRIEAITRYVEAEYSLDSNTLTIPGEIQMEPHASGTTVDQDLGQFFYNISHLPRSKCDQYSKIWSGPAEILEPRVTNESVIIFRDSKGHIRISVALRSAINICTSMGYTTQEKGIMVLLLNKTNQALVFKNTTSQEFTRYDTIKTRFSTMYFDLSLSLQKDFRTTLYQICEARKLLLLHHLSTVGTGVNTALIDPNDAPPGVETLARGAITYVLVGSPLRAKVRNIDHCCNELAIQIRLKNGSVIDTFADPRTSIIKPYCTYRVCDGGFPYMYQLRVINETSPDVQHKYICTGSSPELIECQKRPLKMNPALTNVDLEVDQLLQSHRANPEINVTEAIKLHHKAILVDYAEETIVANTAYDFVRNNPVKLARIVSDAEDTPVYQTFIGKILGSVVAQMSEIWGTLLKIFSVIVSGLVFWKVGRRLLICVAKRVTHDTLDIKKYGMELGSSRVFKNLSAAQGVVTTNVIKDVSSLTESHQKADARVNDLTRDCLRADARIDKAFDLIHRLAMQMPGSIVSERRAQDLNTSLNKDNHPQNENQATQYSHPQ